MRFRYRLLSVVLALLFALPYCQRSAAAGGEAITQAQLLGLLVNSYEFFSGSEVDESAITSKLSLDKSVRKALELDLVDTYEVSWVHLNASRRNTVARVLALKNAMRTDLYGTATAQATVAQACDELGLALKIVRRTSSVDGVAALADGMDGEAPLTRALLSGLLVRVYEALYGEIAVDDAVQPVDSDDIYVRKAMKAGLMPGYAVSNTFEPDAAVQLRQLATPVLALIDHDENALADTSTDSAREIVAELLMSYIGVEKAEGETTGRLLDVSWEWYVNQLTTGKYSANNCMPACGEMVLNYIDRENQVTTAMLRALSPHDGEGWYDVEFDDVLTGQGVKLKSEYDMTVENMLKDIDAGHLLVVMCNFDGAASGHAVVVMGYETTPAGTWFICNDPMSSTTNKYGKPGGYRRRIEAQELLLAMKRHVARYFKVMN